MFQIYVRLTTGYLKIKKNMEKFIMLELKKLFDISNFQNYKKFQKKKISIKIEKKELDQKRVK